MKSMSGGVPGQRRAKHLADDEFLAPWLIVPVRPDSPFGLPGPGYANHVQAPVPSTGERPIPRRWIVVRIGYFLSSEEHGPAELVAQAQAAERAGFSALWISDHFHPWNDEQGNSPFVWSVIGAIAQATSLPVTTAVTCPTVRIHPAIIAQAAATSALLTEGRFVLGVGSGEALNEHILGDVWPEAEVRQEMLAEAIDVIRKLFTGEQVSYYGKHYTVVNARLYSNPATPPPIYISGFGPRSIKLAAEIGDGLMTVQPDAQSVRQFRESGGAGKPVQGGLKVCWGTDEADAVKLAHRLWSNEEVPGALAQELPLPAHFEQASQLVTEDMVAKKVACGPDPQRHLSSIQQFADAGFDEIYVNQIGPDQEGFFAFYQQEILPRLRG
jgi:G6PDH family F420-dependent oxidoreductase